MPSFEVGDLTASLTRNSRPRPGSVQEPQNWQARFRATVAARRRRQVRAAPPIYRLWKRSPRRKRRHALEGLSQVALIFVSV